MAKVELLNTEAHRSLRVRWIADARYRDEGHFVRVVPGEFVAAAAHHPILFAKDAETGAFFAGAVMGFDEGENLFLRGTRHSGYRPLASRRGPFLILGENLAVDVEHSRIDAVAGDAVFEPDGAPSAYLREVQRTLTRLKQGTEESARFMAAMLRLELIEPIDISLSFDDGERRQLEGVYTVSADALMELDDADALALFRAGYLHLAFAVIGSLEQVSALGRMRNERLLDGA